MDPIATQGLPQAPQREPTDAEIQAGKEQIAHLEAEARSAGPVPAAAQLHHSMGRIFEQLGDTRSAAVCYQNAYLLDPGHQPTLEAARRLFASLRLHDKALALHQREEAALQKPEQRAESLRAQAMLLRGLGRRQEADQLVDQALLLAPDHPALLKARVEAAEQQGDRKLAASLLVRSAGATRDPLYRAQLLRRAVVLLDALKAENGEGTPAEVADLQEQAERKLSQADANDPVGFSAMLLRARASNDWEAVLRLCRQRSERTASAADRALVAAIAAYRLGRISEGLAEVTAALEEDRRDGTLLALRLDLAEQQRSADLAELLCQVAQACAEPSERAHLKLRAAMASADPLDK